MTTPNPTSVLRRGLLGLGFLAGLALPLHAATYYIDYAGGDNNADGLSARTAWKHAPGDASATGKPASAALVAGDTVLFKGGVTYFGSLNVKASGTADKPVIYDGNTAGSFGSGRAILDGGQLITEWKKLGSADEAKGNAKWREMFYADIDIDVTSNARHDRVVLHRQTPTEFMAPWQRVILIDGDESILPIAQHPKPKDAFYPDLPADFLVTKTPLELRKDENVTLLTDTERLTQKDPKFYEGVMVGIHAGNNHVFFADIKSFDPAKNQLTFPLLKDSVYKNNAQYALYNSPRYIELPGEWSITPLGNGKSRVYVLPLRLEKGLPANVAYPVRGTALTVSGGNSHLRIQGFLIRRFAGEGGGISIARSNNPRSKNIVIANNEIRFVSGHAAIGVNYVDDVVVENNYIRHCPGWTSGIFMNRPTGFKVTGNHLIKNSGSGIRFYEGVNGTVSKNTVLDHFGMHSSGLNFYEGSTDITVEDNFVENVVTMNRNAERIIFRNNVIDSKGRNAVGLSFWPSGSVRGKAIRDVQVLNNTFVNINPASNWGAGFYGQPSKTVSAPEGLVVRGNVMDRPGGMLAGVFENNIYLRPPAANFPVAGVGNVVEADLNKLFRDPAKQDFRRKPGGPLPENGANLPPPAAK